MAEHPDPDGQRRQVAAVFDAVADTYDQVGVDSFGPIGAALVNALAPQPGERALDVGCGRGAVLFALAEAVGPTGRAVGIDLSENMVAATRADAESRGIAVEVRVAPAEEPGFAAGSFDIVTSSAVLFFLPDPLVGLQAWHHALSEGGRLGVSTFGPFSESWKPVDEVFAAYRPTAPPGPQPQPAANPFASDEGMEALVAEAGFADVRTLTMTQPVRFADEDQWYRWSMSQGQRKFWTTMPEEDRPVVRDEAYRRMQATRQSDGRFGYDQQVRFTLARR